MTGTNLAEIEGRIADGEALMRRSGSASIIGWIFLVVGLLLFSAYWPLSVLIMIASIWRLFSVEKYKKEIENGLRDYRVQKAHYLSNPTAPTPSSAHQPVVDSANKICPYCAETIQAKAIACRYCNRDLPT